MNIIDRAKTSTDGFGRWRAHVVLAGNIGVKSSDVEKHWATIRRTARDVIVEEIARREQTTSETWQQAVTRVRQSLPRLVVVHTDTDNRGRIHGITFGEP